MARIQQPAPPNISQIVRSSGYKGVMTATTIGGPVMVHDMFTAALDATNIWVRTLVATGTANVGALGGTIPFGGVAFLAGAASDSAKIVLKISSVAAIGNPLAATAGQTPYSQLWAEFGIKGTTTTNLDNTTFGVGFFNINNTWVGRTTAGLIAFANDAGTLTSVTDKAGTETATTLTGAPSFANYHVWKIGVNTTNAQFFIDGVLYNTHTANLLNNSNLGFGVFCGATAGGAAMEVDFGPVRVWLEE